jgi:hypothetical protein
MSKTRTTEAISTELEQLTKSIEKRHEWLNNPTNRMRGTYTAVANDTRKMEQLADELRHELEYATTKCEN